MSGSKKSVVDDELLDWVIREEGFIDKPRDIGDGKITLGSGLTDPKWHSLYRQRGNKWSQEDNRAAVKEELEKRRKWAEDTVPNWDSLPEHSQKAMLSYKYNYNFTPTNSPLLFQAMNDGRFIDAMYQMDATSKDPKFRKGLENRRKREQEWGIMDLLERPSRNPFDGYAEEFPDRTFAINPYTQGIEAITPKPAAIPVSSNNYVDATVSPDNRSSIDAVEAMKRLRTITQLNNSLDWNNQPEPTHFVPKGQIDYVAHSEGGSLKRKMWDDLSMREKAEMIKVAVRNGITNMPDIRKKYNEFAEGGELDEDYLYPITDLPEVTVTPTRAQKEQAWRKREGNIAKSLVSHPTLPNLFSATEHYANSIPGLFSAPSEITGVTASEPLLPDVKNAAQLMKAGKVAKAIEDAVKGKVANSWIKKLPISRTRYYRQVRPDALDSYRANGVISQFNEYGNNPTEHEVPMFTKAKPSLYRKKANILGDVWVVSKPKSNLTWESVNGAAMSPKYKGEFNKAPISEFEFYQYDPARGYFKLNDELTNAPFSNTPHVDYLNGLSKQHQIEYLTQNGLNDQWLYTLKNNPTHLESALREAAIPQNIQITAENAASITPAQWTAAQDAAIARGDMAEAQRLRDLHFKVSAPNTKTDVPLWTSSEEAFNSFDLSHFGETDSGFFGYGHYLTPIEKYAATYHPVNRKFYANIENPYIGNNDQYFNRIQYVKDRLAMRKENVMRNLRDGKLTKFSKKLGINENTSLEDAERLVDKYIADETIKWNDKYVKYADEFEGKDGVLSWRDLQGIPNKQEGIYREVVVPRGKQIKSADAVTYDNNGVRIPLGERDNFNVNDIRYSWLLPILGGTTAATLASQKAFGGNLFEDGGNINTWLKAGLSVAKALGIDKKYKGKPEDFRYKQNLYSIIDPTTGFPRNVEEAMSFKSQADEARNPKNSFKYIRKYRDDTADAGWAKRLGLPYDQNLLIDNSDGSVRLSEAVEAEIPTDTLFLENRIKTNEELLAKYRRNGAASPERTKLISEGIKADRQALDALRLTYRTGKPVVINEDANNSRRWLIDSVPSWKPSPLNILHNYTIQYDKDNNVMNYWDLYDFNQFEDFVPGDPYTIKGSIKLK